MCFRKLCLALRFLIVFGVLSFLLPLAAGCGGGKGSVSGTVTLDGQPLPVGNITFLPSNGPGATGPIEDGKYSVKGVPTGQVTVTVETISIKKEIESVTKSSPKAPKVGTATIPQDMAKVPENARAKMEQMKKQADERTSRVKDLQAKYREVPGKYSRAEASGLATTVNKGQNTFDVQLSSK